MNEIEFRLRAFFRERSARRLSRPALLATGCAAALGAIAVAPSLATAGVGMIIGGIAVNIASSWVERWAALPPDDEEGRTAALEDGLAARDPAALAVATATLAAAGPDLARALPDEARAAFITTLTQAMEEAGGPLAALAPAYRAALTAPAQADWNAIRASAQQQIQISAQVLAGEGAKIARSGIAVRDVAARVDARVIAEKGATIEDSGVTIERVGPAADAPAPARTITVGPQVGMGSSASSSPSSYIERADQVNLALPDHEARRQDADLLAYLRRTLHDCNALPLDKVDPTDTTHTRSMELARVYIALDTTTLVAKEGEPGAKDAPGREEQRPLSVLEALASPAGRRAMLLGAPGSGKSTFLSHLTYCLAGAALVARRPTESAPAGGWLSRLPGWPHGPLLPVPLILRDLAADPAVATAKKGSVALISDFLKAHASKLGCPHAAEALLAALRAGEAILLLDGLDEVVGADVLPRIAEAISDAAKNFPGPILVTCRVLDYQDERLRQLAGFAPLTLADLRADQVEQFIAAWYRELAASGRRDPAEAAAATREMQGAVQSRDELRALAGSPLLLTLMAQVHAFRGTLPDARALLYYSCIDLLLLKWRQPRDEPDLIAKLGLSRFRSGDLLALMARLGYTAHVGAERSGQIGSADLSEAAVMEVLTETFAAYDKERKFQLAEMVLNALANGNGLLLKRGPKLYTFAHRTFQEFLAGYHLKRTPNAPIECQLRAGQIHWHEALLLMVGYQVLGENELERPISLAAKLLERGPLEQILAGEMLGLVGRERARSSFGARPSDSAQAAGFDTLLASQDRHWAAAIKALRVIQSRSAAPDVPAALRHRAGLALGRLCYGELKDLVVASALPAQPDPRLPFSMLGTPLQAHPNWSKSLAHYWCPIEAGPFWSGDDRKEQLQQVTISTAYRIARYPITNADYARFLAANGSAGYDPAKPWWMEHGRTYLLPGGFRYPGDPEQITQPRLWTVARYNGPLQPVVGVSWYEAAAYCRWLTSEGWQQGWLPPDQEIRLPSWHEWERAARHTDQRKYPWGDPQPDPERANYDETRLNAPSPVGSFPAGAAACGAQDMAGNVLEWTASQWEKWGSVEKDFTDRSPVSLSLSSWFQKLEQLCCGARDWLNPGLRYDNLGFRIIQSLRSS